MEDRMEDSQVRFRSLPRVNLQPLHLEVHKALNQPQLPTAYPRQLLKQSPQDIRFPQHQRPLVPQALAEMRYGSKSTIAG
jgi:hypothetical protein